MPEVFSPQSGSSQGSQGSQGSPAGDKESDSSSTVSEAENTFFSNAAIATSPLRAGRQTTQNILANHSFHSLVIPDSGSSVSASTPTPTRSFSHPPKSAVYISPAEAVVPWFDKDAADASAMRSESSVSRSIGVNSSSEIPQLESYIQSPPVSSHGSPRKSPQVSPQPQHPRAEPPLEFPIPNVASPAPPESPNPISEHSASDPSILDDLEAVPAPLGSPTLPTRPGTPELDIDTADVPALPVPEQTPLRWRQQAQPASAVRRSLRKSSVRSHARGFSTSSRALSVFDTSEIDASAVGPSVSSLAQMKELQKKIHGYQIQYKLLETVLQDALEEIGRSDSQRREELALRVPLAGLGSPDTSQMVSQAAPQLLQKDIEMEKQRQRILSLETVVAQLRTVVSTYQKRIQALATQVLELELASFNGKKLHDVLLDALMTEAQPMLDVAQFADAQTRSLLTLFISRWREFAAMKRDLRELRAQLAARTKENTVAQSPVAATAAATAATPTALTASPGVKGVFVSLKEYDKFRAAVQEREVLQEELEVQTIKVEQLTNQLKTTPGFSEEDSDVGLNALELTLRRELDAIKEGFQAQLQAAQESHNQEVDELVERLRTESELKVTYEMQVAELQEQLLNQEDQVEAEKAEKAEKMEATNGPESEIAELRAEIAALQQQVKSAEVMKEEVERQKSEIQKNYLSTVKELEIQHEARVALENQINVITKEFNSSVKQKQDEVTEAKNGFISAVEKQRNLLVERNKLKVLLEKRDKEKRSLERNIEILTERLNELSAASDPEHVALLESRVLTFQKGLASVFLEMLQYLQPHISPQDLQKTTQRIHELDELEPMSSETLRITDSVSSRLIDILKHVCAKAGAAERTVSGASASSADSAASSALGDETLAVRLEVMTKKWKTEREARKAENENANLRLRELEDENAELRRTLEAVRAKHGLPDSVLTAGL